MVSEAAGAGSRLEIHRGASPLGVRIPRPPPLNRSGPLSHRYVPWPLPDSHGVHARHDARRNSSDEHARALGTPARVGVDRAHDALLVSCGAALPLITALALTLTRWSISHRALAFVSALGSC